MKRGALFLLLAGCGAEAPYASAAIVNIEASLASGQMHGTLTIEETADGVRIYGELDALVPVNHGLHVFAGECNGAHLNPDGKRHGGLADAESHAGDLGNIAVGEDRVGRVDITISKLKFDDGERGVLGRKIGVSRSPDDLMTDPDGGSLDTIACGTIELRE